MCLKGELGNLGEPDCFLVENTVDGVPPERETPGVNRYSHLLSELVEQDTKKTRKQGIRLG
jgi:hypothetical protein